jgi:hypothetical protein
MTKREKKTWETQRAIGRTQIILRYGLLRCGLPFGLLFGIYQAIRPALFGSPPRPWTEILALATFAALFLGGAMGVNYWHSNEKDYARPSEDEDMA